MLHDVNILVAVVIMVTCSIISNNNSTTSNSSSIIHRCNHLLHLTVSFQVATEVEVAGTTLGLHSNNKILMI
jgi:hypothetical protein